MDSFIQGGRSGRSGATQRRTTRSVLNMRRWIIRLLMHMLVLLKCPPSLNPSWIFITQEPEADWTLVPVVPISTTGTRTCSPGSELVSVARCFCTLVNLSFLQESLRKITHTLALKNEEISNLVCTLKQNLENLEVEKHTSQQDNHCRSIITVMTL